MVKVVDRLKRTRIASRSVAGICTVACVLAGLWAQASFLAPRLSAQTAAQAADGVGTQSKSPAAATTTQLSIATQEGETRPTALFTIHVLAAAGTSATPAGSVTLMLGETPLASTVLDENGFATYTTESLPQGHHQVVAVYEGNAYFAASKSSARPLAAAAPTIPDFTFLPTGPTALSVKAGQFATTTFLLTPENGYNQIVSYSCSGLPLATTCTFTPTQVLPNGVDAVATTLNIQTVAITGGTAARTPSGIGPAYALLLPGLLALMGLGAARKRLPGLRMLCLAVLLIVSGVGLQACSAQYSYYRHPPTVNKGTPAGVSTVIVYASSSNNNVSIVHTRQIVLTVTN